MNVLQATYPLTRFTVTCDCRWPVKLEPSDYIGTAATPPTASRYSLIVRVELVVH